MSAVRVRRLTWTDSRREGEGSRVFVGGLEIKVSPIATLLLDQLDRDGWTDARDLVAMVEETYGPPPHTNTLTAVRHTLRELERVGIVELDAVDGDEQETD